MTLILGILSILLVAALITVLLLPKLRVMSKLQSVDVVTDLDAILNRTVGVRFRGKTHKIAPLSTVDFIKASNAFAAISMLTQDSVKSGEELLDHYAAVFEITCPTVKRKDLEGMTQQQIGALFQVVLDQYAGKSAVSAQKKNEPVKAEQSKEQSS